MVLAAYLVRFYCARLPTVEQLTGTPFLRCMYFGYLRSPGLLLADWFGSPAQFSLADRLPILMVAGAVVAMGLSAGWLLLRAVRADRGLTRLETFVFSLAVGLNVLATYVLLAGLAGGLHFAVMAVPGLLCVTTAVALWIRRGRVRNPKSKIQNPKSVASDRLWLWLAAPFLAVIVLGAMLPPVEFDVREYHLQVPKEFYQQGRITFLPHNVYGNMPLGTEMLSLLAMVLSGDWWLGALAGKTVTALMAPLTALGLLAAGRRFFSAPAGAAAALLYLSTPWIVRISTAGLIDGAAGCYLLLAVYAMLLWARGRGNAAGRVGQARASGRSPTSPASSRWGCGRQGGLDPPYVHAMLLGDRTTSRLILAGFLAGSAAAVKYPGLLFVVLPLAAWSLLAALRSQPGVVAAANEAGPVSPGGHAGCVVAAANEASPVSPGGHAGCAAAAANEASPVSPGGHAGCVVAVANEASPVSPGGYAGCVVAVANEASPVSPGGHAGCVVAAARSVSRAARSFRTRTAGKQLAIFLAAAALACGPWLAKNAVLTGNPTYPLLYATFGGKSWTAEKNDRWNRVHRPHDFSPSALATSLAQVGLTSEWLSPLVVPLAALALALRRHRAMVVRLWLLFGYVIAAWWLSTHRIDRFWIPALPLLCLAAGPGISWSPQKSWRWVLTGLLGLVLLGNFLVASSSGPGSYNRYFVSLGRLRDDPLRVTAWHRYFNREVSQGRLLLVGDAEPFDLEMPVLYSTCFDDSPLELLTQGRTASEVRSRLREAGITHVYVDWGEIARYRQSDYGFTPYVRPEVFGRLVDEGVLRPLAEFKGDPGRGYEVLY